MANEKIRKEPPWWVSRKSELISVASQITPVIVYDDESFNEVFFDLLCLEGVHVLLYSVRSNDHWRVLEKILKLGGLLKCSSMAELERLQDQNPPVTPAELVIESRCFPLKSLNQLAPRVKAILAPVTQYAEFRKPDVMAFLSFDFSVERRGLTEIEWAKSKLLKASQILGAHAAELKGVHIWTDKEISTLSSYAVELIASTKKLFPGVRNVVLGKGLAIARDKISGQLDIQHTRERYGTLATEFPEMRFWMDPEHLAIEHAGGLLTKVQDVHVTTEGMVMEISLPAAFFCSIGKGQTCMSIHDLSADKALRADMVLCNRYMSPRDRAFLRIKGRVEKGNLIFITGLGALGMGLDMTSLGLHIHYLCARRMCAVKL